MPKHFDPYYKWLGIPPKDQPPNHYRLLAIELFEADTDVISDAAEQRMAHVRNYHLGQYMALSQQILNELATAKVCLLNPQKKAEYDRQLRAKLTPEMPTPVASPTTLPSPQTALPPPPIPDVLDNTPIYTRPRIKKTSWKPWVFAGVGGLAVLAAIVLGSVLIHHQLAASRTSQSR